MLTPAHSILYSFCWNAYSKVWNNFFLNFNILYLPGNKPFQLLEELAHYEDMKNNKESADVSQILAEIHHTFSHWILRFPAQCVLAAEAVMWERIMFKALERSDVDEVKLQKYVSKC